MGGENTVALERTRKGCLDGTERAEVFMPRLPAWVKERHSLAGGGIERVSLAALELITAVAGQPQAIPCGWAARNPRNDVLEHERHAREECRAQTVAAPITCILLNDGT